MNWTEQELKKRLEAGTIRGYESGKSEKQKKRRAKFNNEKVEYDGHVFDSKKEYHRYRELLLRLKAGDIGLLKLQESFELIPKSETERKCCYKADFTYIDSRTGEKVVEDVKSEATRKLSTYIMKRKLMLSIYGITIKEI